MCLSREVRVLTSYVLFGETVSLRYILFCGSVPPNGFPHNNKKTRLSCIKEVVEVAMKHAKFFLDKMNHFINSV